MTLIQLISTAAPPRPLDQPSRGCATPMAMALTAMAALAYLTGPSVHTWRSSSPRGRARELFAYEGDSSSTNVQTEGGLSWTTMVKGDGEAPSAGQVVLLSYTATLARTGQLLDSNTAFQFEWGCDPVMQPNRRFAWGVPASASPLLPLFQEAIEGAVIGESRRVNVPPSSEFASLEEETVQFLIELKAITTGPEANAYRASQFWKQANIGPFFIVATFVLFLQDDVQGLISSYLPSPMSMSERAAESFGSGIPGM